MKISYYRHIFWKNKYWKRLNSRKWTPEKDWNFFDLWKLIPTEYNFMTHENKYLRKIVFLRQLDIFLSLKTLLQRDNILSVFLSVWMGKIRWNQNTASNYATNWNKKISSCGCTGKSLIWYNTSMVFSSLSSLFIIFSHNMVISKSTYVQ